MPGLALFADPHGCNAQGNGQAFVSSWGGPVGSGRIAGATHCDPEFPSNGSCTLFCGKPNPERHARFVELATLTLRAGLSCDEAALASLNGAGQTSLVEDWNVDELLAGLQTRCASGSPTTPALPVD